MNEKLDLSSFHFAPVMNYPPNMPVLDLTGGYNPDRMENRKWAVGRYNEKRESMYTAPQYNNRRNIHMGIDIWAAAGEDVYAFYDGEVAYLRDNDREGDYGPTIVTRHQLGSDILFALFGHLSGECLSNLGVGQPIGKGARIAEVGTRRENGGWVPHLHFQLSTEDPGEADMPGVVAEEDREEALKKFPDPRLVVGEIF